jgi:hypothetical protein
MIIDNFLIKIGPSIFTSRAGKNDVTIWKESEDRTGAKFDEKYYRSIAKFCAETGETLRSYGQLPPTITMPLLKQWGLVKQYDGWFCERCQQIVAGKEVTFDEHHDKCGGKCK